MASLVSMSTPEVHDLVPVREPFVTLDVTLWGWGTLEGDCFSHSLKLSHEHDLLVRCKPKLRHRRYCSICIRERIAIIWSVYCFISDFGATNL